MEFEEITDVPKEYQFKCPKCMFGYLFPIEAYIYQCHNCKRIFKAKNLNPSLNNDSKKVCPKFHGAARQLTKEGYCMDCGDYPYGKPSSES